MTVFPVRTDMAINVTNAVLGILLFVSPWLLGFTGDPHATWNAWAGGAVVILIAILAVSHLYDWEEWLNLIAGLWIGVSPWMLDFNGITSALAVHVVIGLCIVALAAMELLRIYQGGENRSS